MRRLLALLAICLWVASPASAADASIDDVIDSEMSASGVPGLAYAVVDGGDITAVGARGVVNRDGDTEVTPKTPFLTGSISKSFTALAVMQLVESDEVSLDADVARYLDDFADQPGSAITIRQLLSHTSGFSTLQGNVSRTDATGEKDELARGVARIARLTPAYWPGERWAYSNTNYQVLGRVIEVVSGQDYQTYVASHILEPIGMEDSFVADGRAHESMATGHTPWFGSKRALPADTTSRSMAPQGGIIASATDLARYLQVMMNGEDDVLSAEGKAQMMRPASGVSPYYGFGWNVDPANGQVWHDGTSPGFETLATMVPAEQKGVVVLVNGGSGMGFGETAQLRNAITASALGVEYDGEGSRLFPRATFVALALAPAIYLLSMVWAWRHRAGLRAKTDRFGRFSLWFPLLTTLGAAWVILHLVPVMIGAPFGTIRVFQPDLGLAFLATAVSGVLWAVFRLGVAYTGGHTRSAPQESPPPQ